MNELYNLIPEFILIIFACVVLIIPLFAEDSEKNKVCNIAILGLLIAFCFMLNDLTTKSYIIMDGHLKRDALSDLLKLSILVVSFLTVLYSKSYIVLNKFETGEYCALLFLSLLGMFVLVSSNTLLSLYMGLELFSLPLYALVAMKKSSKLSAEAAMKYFVTGAIASGFLLYGISLIFGVTKTINNSDIANFIAQSQDIQLALSLGLVFMLIGAAFKLGAAPFHMWMPDVYTGAPVTVTLFIASASKIAALGMVIKILIEILNGLFVQWHTVLTIIAILSIGLGNLVAIMQTNIKRLLAYSAIAHAGYVLLGLISGTTAGYSASVFYSITYALTMACLFGSIIMLSKDNEEITKINQLQGLSLRSPWLALVMLLLILSLAGIPPLVGFYGKLAVISSIVNSGNIYLSVYAMLFSVVGAYYYLNLIRIIYFDSVENVLPLVINSGERAIIGINIVIILLLGLIPGILLSYCNYVFK